MRSTSENNKEKSLQFKIRNVIDQTDQNLIVSFSKVSPFKNHQRDSRYI